MAVSVAALKAAAAVASDRRVRTFVISVIVGIIAAAFLAVGGIISMVDYGSQSNKQAVSYIFNNTPEGLDLWDIPDDYKDELKLTRTRVNAVGAETAGINEVIAGEKIDSEKARVMYLCLFPNGEINDYGGFVSCFYTVSAYESEAGETLTVYTAETNESQIYANISIKFGVTITAEQRENINATYVYVTTGAVFLAPYEDTGPPGEAYSDAAFAQLMGEATKYIGYPYVFGGSNPQTSFDCSGFICWSYTQSGVRNLPRTTAQGIFNQCAPVAKNELKPGDLVFFQGTYNCPDVVTHIGIYVGENKMLHCGNPIGYASLDSAYWTAKWYSGGRLT
jgi:cell wall-associated NlpC family hydrolase